MCIKNNNGPNTEPCDPISHFSQVDSYPPKLTHILESYKYIKLNINNGTIVDFEDLEVLFIWMYIIDSKQN